MKNGKTYNKNRLVFIVVVLVFALIIILIASSSKEQQTFIEEDTHEQGSESFVLVNDVLGPFTAIFLGNTESGNFRISITNSSPEGREKAIEWFKDQGYSLSEMSVDFADFQNPLFGEEIDE